MKKRFLAFMTMAVVLVMSMAVCITAFTASAETQFVDLERPFDSTGWFSDMTKVDTLEDGTLVFSMAKVDGRINNLGNWNRKWYGQEIRRVPLGNDEFDQFMYLYDAGKDDQAPIPEGDAAPLAGWSNFYYITQAVQKSESTEDEYIKVKIRLEKVGAGWEEGCKALRVGIYSKTASEKSIDAITEELNASIEKIEGIKLGEEGTPYEFKKGWFYRTITEEVNAAEGTGYIDVETILPTTATYRYDSLTFQLMFQYSEGATEEIEDLALKIKSITLSYPKDMADVPSFEKMTADFDASLDENLVINVDLKGYDVSAIIYKYSDEDEIAVKKTNYWAADDFKSITIKADYLKSLTNGEHTFIIKINSEDYPFVITVSNAKDNGGEQQGGEDNKGGCGSVITLSGAIISTVMLAGSIMVFRKKED